ncbi:hypothetical protein SVIOM342S_00880 [Streptomyces violaceorubidus]
MAISSARVSSSPPRFRLQFADRRVVSEGQVTGAGRGGESAAGTVAEQHYTRAQGGRLLDAVAEEVVGVGSGGESAGEQCAVRGQRLGEVGDDRGGAGQFGEGGGETAAGGPGGGALGPDDGEGFGQFGRQGLGGVAVGHDGGSAAFGDGVEAVGDLLHDLGRRLEHAGAVQQREKRGEQRPQDAGGGTGEGLVVVVEGGRHRDEQAARGAHRIAERGAGGGDGHDRAAPAVCLFGEQGETRLGAVGGGDQQEVHGTGPAGQLPAQGARGGGNAGGGETGDGAARAGEGAEEVGGVGGGGAGARDQYGTRAAVRLEVADAGIGGVPGGGADAGTGLGGAAEQTAAVGLGQALRGVEERFVEHGGRSPIAGGVRSIARGRRRVAGAWPAVTRGGGPRRRGGRGCRRAPGTPGRSPGRCRSAPCPAP